MANGKTQGEHRTGALYDRCVIDDPMCVSYLVGVGSVMRLVGAAHQDRDFTPALVAVLGVFGLCPARNTPVIGIILRGQFVAWIERNPDRKREPMASSAMAAFKEAWPCPERSN